MSAEAGAAAVRTGGTIPIRAVLFDYGMVLSGPPDAVARQSMQQITGLDEAVFGREYWAYRDAYDRGVLSGRAYWQRVAEGAGITVNESQIDGLLAADTEHWTQPNETMIAWAGGLQDAGVGTGILSNLGDEMMKGLLAKFEWLGRFDHCTWSHTLGIAKPDAAIYAHAVSGLGVEAGAILFIDDREENIAAAAAAGMQTIRYATHEAFEREMVDRGLDDLLHPAPDVTAVS